MQGIDSFREKAESSRTMTMDRVSLIISELRLFDAREETVTAVFREEKIGKVGSVQFQYPKGNKTYARAVVHMAEWEDNIEAQKIRNSLQWGNSEVVKSRARGLAWTVEANPDDWEEPQRELKRMRTAMWALESEQMRLAQAQERTQGILLGGGETGEPDTREGEDGRSMCSGCGDWDHCEQPEGTASEFCGDCSEWWNADAVSSQKWNGWAAEDGDVVERTSAAC